MSKNNKLIFAAIIAIVLLIVGTLVILEWFGPPTTITLDLKGTPEHRFVGTVVVDGVVKRIEGKLPTTLSFDARKIEFAVAPLDDDWLDYMDIRVMVEGKPALQMKARGGRGEYSRPTLLGNMRKRGMIHGLPEEDIAALRKELER